MWIFRGQTRLVRVATRHGVVETGDPENEVRKKRTDDHGGKLEPFADALAVHLVREIGKTDVAHELFADYGYSWDMGLSEGGL